MTALVDIKVPDIGDFADVPVIEIAVKPGDMVAVDATLVTLESDKATMDVPSPIAGEIVEVLVKVGDKVAQGTLVARARAAGAADANYSGGDTALAPAAAASAPAAPVAAAAFAGKVDVDTDLLVLGAGPGGYSAAFRAADLGLKTVIVERYASLGGVCLNVGCIPSKALLHVAEVMEAAAHGGDLGVTFAPPTVDIDKLRAHKAKVVGKLTTGLAGMAKARKVEVVRGYGHFLDAHHLEVEETTGAAQDKTGKTTVVRFKQCIIAAGSAAVHLPFIPQDERIVDSTGALELRTHGGKPPSRLLVIGGGIIGLEMATV